MLTVVNLSNIRVTGDAGSEILMHKAEYASLLPAEGRHAVNIWSCSTVTVSGVILANTGGDGIFLAGTNTNSNISITNVIANGCGRNGVSVLNVNGLTITNCIFENSEGEGNVAANGPWSGIDFEPTFPFQTLRNISVSICYFKNNGGCGFVFYGPGLSGSTGILNMTVTGCVMDGNGANGIAFACVPASLSSDSSVVFQDCTIINNEGAGVWLDSKSAAAGTLP